MVKSQSGVVPAPDFTTHEFTTSRAHRHPMLTPFEADTLTILPGIRHGFFTRQGGVSRGLYASLNCGQGSNDDRVAVVENRARIARHLGSPEDDVQTLHQVHSADALVVEALVPRERLAKADALVTKVPGLALGVLTADCAPVLLADPQAKVVAAAHAGWRGALAGVLEATIAAMEGIGADRKQIHAAVGPSIGAGAYEVGPEFEAEFLRMDEASGVFFRRGAAGTRPRFDLPGYVNHKLSRLGLRSVEKVAHCTYENESLFFSYRRSRHRSEPDYGRQISAIVVT
jgi:YfiH family protein